jgi:hypothetical protein
MSTYPGEDPQQSPAGQQPDDQQPADGNDEGDAEPTQPVGYWERQAAEQARQQPQQGDPDPAAAQGDAVFNPTSAQPPPGWEQGATRPYEQQNPYGQAPYAQPGQPSGQPPYGQPPYAQPYYGQPAYSQQPPYGYPPPGGQSGPPMGSHPGYPPYAFTPPAPDHKQATLSLVLGICGLVFGFTCGIGFLASPFAWALGHNAVKEIRASQGRLGGEGTAKAGMVIGIVGTVLLVLAVLALIVFAVVVAATDTSSGSSI